MPDKSPFQFTDEYKKTGMKSAHGSQEMFVESCWNEAAKKNGMLKVSIGDKSVVVKAMDLLSNMIAHSGEKEARYMSDGLMHKTKKKYTIDYDFYVKLQKFHSPGEMLHCAVKIQVPEEFIDKKEIVRKHIAYEKESHGTPMISAPKKAGELNI